MFSFFKIDNTYSMSNFLRSKKLRDRISKAGDPYLMTNGGRALVIVQNIKGYQALMELAEHGRRFVELQQMNEKLSQSG